MTTIVTSTEEFRTEGACRTRIAKAVLDQPRVSLANLPTPIVPVDYRWGSTRLFVKRDDLTGSALTGNKVRKLEYFIGDAQRRGCDTLLTCGGLQSNHARSTAIAAAQSGLKCVLLLGGRPPTEVDGNLLLSRMAGAEVRFVTDLADPDDWPARLSATADTLRAAGRRPYVIPYGGADAIGALGYMRAAFEIQAQLRHDAIDISCIVTAIGGGGTFVGTLLGQHLTGMNLRVIGAPGERTLDAWRPLLGVHLRETARRWDIDYTVSSEQLDLINAAGAGYAVSMPEEVDFIVSFARQTGLFLDPIYSGKALFALDREIRGGRLDPGGNVLFLQTGGIFGLFPKRDLIRASVERLQCRWGSEPCPVPA